ncbi:glycosyltransferase family 4 protein [Cylindrospermopsis raciborskii CS-506_D]|uniref:Glycosyltransferase family 4 protein n=1 Tax=Cylindrospermopsis raciborskii CS-506_A TaxID=2585140 RepID=A0A838WTT3_9CYAN|nr:glycosyltransferase family 4 protein [Cylindrospermopsis raciborskii]MBA4445331.1 glycosyltransferase family 4 protein [Cylindrospermopsis raciborskii CS-506_C]MBA4449572.1 glycosyltransferase family 4 protein [Cylindrospermopsis raciborskii CS-506_D]MBA4456193.1 glycosyltransferase family 4 protein [Cylindrospermopsis raciborskii CS-506_B]MBA4465539.1 glycosyltransferase family 4 protein [Cylindrospermopsis raciborskii CS-506_A]OHY41071.1 glycosyltransferase WbuB [Cylindrospermopsis racibo
MNEHVPYQINRRKERYVGQKQTNSKKLGVITEFFPPDYAATGQLIEELVRQLDHPELEIEVFTGQPGYAYSADKAPAKQLLGGVRIRRTRATRVWSKRIRGKAINGVFFTLRAFFHIIGNFYKYDVFLLTSAPPFLPLAAYLAKLLCGCSYICLVYDIYPDVAIALNVIKKDHWIVKVWRELNRRIWTSSQEIIVLSDDMKRVVIKHYPQLMDKVSVIHSWGDPELILPMEKQDNWFAREHNLVNKFTVLYSGNVGRCHDMETIFHTAQLLAQEENIQFVCIGSGAKIDVLRENVTEMKLSNFLFLPYQHKSTLPYSLTACDLSLVSLEYKVYDLVAPSKLYPALAASRPIAIISPEECYLRKMVNDGQFGLGVNNGDSLSLANFILRLSGDRQLVEQMGKAGRSYLEANFTIKKIAREYWEIISDHSH